MQDTFWYTAAKLAGALRPRRRLVRPWPAITTLPGISVVIPSRNGRDLLAAQLPGIVGDLRPFPSEIIVVDNGSGDGTADWLATKYPQVRVEISPQPLSFARAVNRGIAVARHSHLCLLNNDMILEPDFFAALVRAFEHVPDLFCATAQIFFPTGVRREETGKAVYFQPSPVDFPIRCDEPIAGEDLTWVLYGSGGCSLYDTAKLRELGSIDPVYEPAYVEDLDIGYRAWLRNWPTVYVSGARLEHRHRATSSRYFTQEQLDEILEINYLRFITRAVADRTVFRKLWMQAIDRLRILAPLAPSARNALRAAAAIVLDGGPDVRPAFPEEELLAMSAGGVAVFAGSGGGVRVVPVDKLETPAPAVETIVQVRRSDGPLAYRAAVSRAVRRWGAEAVTSSQPAESSAK